MRHKTRALNTAVDEYLFGTQPVLMALQTQERRLKKLFVKDGERETSYISLAKRLATKRGIPVSKATVSLLDKYSGLAGGTHNGLCLLSSKLSPTPLLNLREANINGSASNFELETSVDNWKKRKSNHAHPFVLVLDRVSDPQNLGAIIRTASFLGIDALVLTERETCPLSAHVSKASAGALETFIPCVYSIKSIKSFTRNAKENGFRIFTTPLSSKESEKTMVVNKETYAFPLLLGPTMLILGNEGKGLRSPIADADFELKIEGYGSSAVASNESYAVESLNLSVAAGVLLTRILFH